MNTVAKDRLFARREQIATLFLRLPKLIGGFIHDCPIRTSPLDEATSSGSIND